MRLLFMGASFLRHGLVREAIPAHGDAAKEGAALGEWEKAAFMNKGQLVGTDAKVNQGGEKQGDENGAMRSSFSLHKISAIAMDPEEEQNNKEEEDKQPILVKNVELKARRKVNRCQIMIPKEEGQGVDFAKLRVHRAPEHYVLDLPTDLAEEPIVARKIRRQVGDVHRSENGGFRIDKEKEQAKEDNANKGEESDAGEDLSESFMGRGKAIQQGSDEDGDINEGQ